MATVVKSMIDDLVQSEYNYHGVSKEEFDEFEKCWIIYILQEKRYGQAFCEHFNLGNATPLYHFKDETISRRWVNDNYLVK